MKVIVPIGIIQEGMDGEAVSNRLEGLSEEEATGLRVSREGDRISSSCWSISRSRSFSWGEGGCTRGPIGLGMAMT